MTEPLTAEEEAEVSRRINLMSTLLNQILEIMNGCPFPDEPSRISAVMQAMQHFEPAHFELMAAVAVERLHRVNQTPSPVIENIAGGDAFFDQLVARLADPPPSVRDLDRDVHLTTMATLLFKDSTKEQLALLSAIGLFAAAENEQRAHG